MTLREAIGQYIAWRRAQGARFQSQAYALRRYCRRVGDGVDCDAVRSDQVSVFLETVRLDRQAFNEREAEFAECLVAPGRLA